jgi:uncharacterized protein (DUF885 family)
VLLTVTAEELPPDSAELAPDDRLPGLEARYRAAVDAYRARLQGMLPEAAELIAGDSVEDLDRAFEQARSLVERLRQQAAEAARREAARQVLPVPLGRTPPDLDSLPAVEKIRLGLQNR